MLSVVSRLLIILWVVNEQQQLILSACDETERCTISNECSSGHPYMNTEPGVMQVVESTMQPADHHYIACYERITSWYRSFNSIKIPIGLLIATEPSSGIQRHSYHRYPTSIAYPSSESSEVNHPSASDWCIRYLFKLLRSSYVDLRWREALPLYVG